MFTGIITHLGRIAKKTDASLLIKTDAELIGQLSKGASIAVNGVCLTVVDLEESSFQVEYMPETADKTNIKYLQADNQVNLELPATASSLLSGHIVQGHVDGVAKLESISGEGNSHILKFSIAKELTKYLVEKGSVTVNGISLTIIACGQDFFTVGIIPHTWDKTMLHSLDSGEFVNLEVDVLAKYIEKLVKV